MANATIDGFSFEGQGTLDRIDTFTSQAGKQILTLIFRQGGQYPKAIPIKVFGRLAEDASAWKPGTVLHVTGVLGGRDWQGKVFGDNVATSVKVLVQAKAQPQGALPLENTDGSDSVPF